MSTHKHGGEKTKTLEQTNVASTSFILLIVFFISIIVSGCIETGNETKYAINKYIGRSQLNLELNSYSGETATGWSLV